MKINRDFLVSKLQEVKDQRMSYGNNEDVELEDVNNLDTKELILLRDEVDNLSADLRTLKRFLEQRLKGRLENKAFRLEKEYLEEEIEPKWFHMIHPKFVGQ